MFMLKFVMLRFSNVTLSSDYDIDFIFYVAPKILFC